MRSSSSQKGIALPTVLVFIIVLLILGFALTTYGTFEQQNSRRQADEAQAFYIARAGAASLEGYISNFDVSTLQGIQTLSDFITTIATGQFGAQTAFGADQNASFRLKAELADNAGGTAGVLTITSEGTYKTRTKTVTREISYTRGPLSNDPLGLIDHAVFAMQDEPGNIDLGNGDIWYDGSQGSDVTDHAIGTNQYDPALVSLKQNSNLSSAPASAISNPAVPPRSYTYPSQTIPFRSESYTPSLNMGSQTISGTTQVNIPTGAIYKYTSLTISGNAIFNTNGETFLIIDTLSITNKGKMMFTGSGPIYILVKSATLDGELGCSTSCYTIKNGKYTHKDGHGPGSDCFIGRVNLMYDGNMTLVVNGNNYDRVSYISGDQAIEIKLTGGAEFSGHIFTNASVDFNITGNASYTGLVYAPEADIRGRGNADIYGVVIGESIDFNGNKMNVIYQNIMKSSLPFLYPDFYDKRDTAQDKGIHETEGGGGGGAQVTVRMDFLPVRWK